MWRDAFTEMGPAASGRLVRDNGMAVVSLCRGGFFTADTAKNREKAIDENRHYVDEAAALGAPLIVLVCV